MTKKQPKEKESVYHFVTVIGCLLGDDSDTMEDYDKAIQYTLEFIKYRYDPKNIK